MISMTEDFIFLENIASLSVQILIGGIKFVNDKIPFTVTNASSPCGSSYKNMHACPRYFQQYKDCNPTFSRLKLLTWFG